VLAQHTEKQAGFREPARLKAAQVSDLCRFYSQSLEEVSATRNSL